MVTRELARAAGVLVAESLEDFDDLLRLAVALETPIKAGARLGLVSNAGFECVAMADSLGDFVTAKFSAATDAALGDIFKRARLDTIVDVHNPLDLTPIMNDEAFVASVRVMLLDDDVDLGVVGCVPLSAAIATLPRGAEHQEDLARPEAIGPRLVALRREIAKPFVVVIDSGPLYDPLVRLLEEGGICTFRRADRALNLLGRLAGPVRPIQGG